MIVFCWLVVVLFGFVMGGFCRTLGWVYVFCCWLVFCVLMVRLVGFVYVWLYVLFCLVFVFCWLVLMLVCFECLGLVFVCWVGSILGFVMCYYEVVGWLVVCVMVCYVVYLICCWLIILIGWVGLFCGFVLGGVLLFRLLFCLIITV